MFKHLLIPTDGSDLSVNAIKRGVEFAKETGARITFVTVTIPFPHSPMSEYAGQTHAIYDAEMKKAADERLSAASEIARAAGVSCDTRSYHDWSPYQAILQAANDVKSDVIFMASHGRSGVAGMLLGSETQKVLTHGKLPVIVYR
jgi:nucleotide-binding universal stress UspA family protein